MFDTLTRDLMDLRSYEAGSVRTLAATPAAKCCTCTKLCTSTSKLCCCTTCVLP